MRILSISAQKPSSTGSGIYLTELVRVLAKQGHEQAVIAGVYPDDDVPFPEGVSFFPVYFGGEDRDISYPICGMSDEMPYRSTRYRDMTPEMVREFREAFVKALDRAEEAFHPDLILCHHLYLLTSIVREHFPGKKVYGFCHNTDLRQMEKHGLEREYIKKQICGLDRIFAPQKPQGDEVARIYGVDPGRVTLVGTGYNRDIFRRDGSRVKDGVTRVLYAGKIAEKKGVMSLIRAMERMDLSPEKIRFKLAGGAGNEAEYSEIRWMADASKYGIEFPGKLNQKEIAAAYNACDIFVLPSFFDSIPLTVIEALACGAKVVVSELPGIRDFLTEHVPGANVRYVPLPTMRNSDEPVPEELPEFERRLAEALTDAAADPEQGDPDLSDVSWDGIAKICIS